MIHKKSGEKRSVLFVCTANQCRSPMAMVLFIDFLARQGEQEKDWRIESAGIWAGKGNPATDLAIKAMEINGLDLSNHHSQPVTELLLNEFNLTLCMENEHKSFLKQNYGFINNKIFLLSEMANEVKEIWDPVGTSLELYLNTINEMLNFLENGFPLIKELSM
jgi:protein-tyrosine-phosphatase